MEATDTRSVNSQSLSGRSNIWGIRRGVFFRSVQQVAVYTHPPIAAQVNAHFTVMTGV